jgi:diguanylate cyclase (GGDEF)-like protein
VVAYILLVDVAAVAVLVSTARLTPITPRALVWCALLIAGLIVHKEASHGIERIREIATEGSPHTELQSIWIFAALLLLPPPLVAVVIVTGFGYSWLRVYQRRPPLHRKVFSASTVILAAWTGGMMLALAADIRHDPAGQPAIVALAGPLGLAILVVTALLYWLINYALVVGVIIMTNPHNTGRQALGHATEQLLIWAGVGLGTAVALIMTTRPWLLPILLLTVLALHLGLLLPQFQKAARTDSKTGLATLEFWHQFAGRELARAQATHATLGILIIDLDHFKQINDRYGHLSGDHVLRAVAKAMRSEVRNFDLIARFGGEEFAILMPGITADSIVPAAERVRLAINQVTVTVESIGGGTVTIDKLTASVGAALYPATATDLTALVMSADAALYAAKDSGRNQARLAPSEGIPDSLNPA